MPIAPGAVSMQALPRRPPPSPSTSQENVVSSSSSAAPAARRPIPISQSTDSYFVAARRIQPPSLALASARGLPTIDSLPLLPEEPEAHELSAGDRRSSGERLSAAQGGISLPSAWVHQVKGNIGPGCLALPCVFARIGPTLGVPLVLAVTIPGGYAMLVLVRLKRALCEAGQPVMAYEDVAAVAFGPSGRRLLEWVIMTLQLGISTVYVDIVSAAFRAGAPALRGPVWVALLPCVPLFFGLSLIADIKALLPFSLPGFLIMLTACVGAVAQAAVQMGWLDALGGGGADGGAAGGGDAVPAAAPAFSRPPYDYNALDVATFIGATFYASESICLVLPIETALSADAADPARRCCNFYSTFALAFATAIVAYASVGAMCGHAFPDASGSIVAYLTRVNPGSPFWQTVNVLIGAAVAATFPLQLLPAIAPLEANCCAPGRCAGVAVPYSKVCVVVGITAVAYLVPEVELLTAVFGCMCNSLLGAMPLLVQLQLSRTGVLPCGAAEKAAAVVIVVLVAGAAVVGTAVALGRVWGAMTTEGHPGDGGLLERHVMADVVSNVTEGNVTNPLLLE